MVYVGPTHSRSWASDYQGTLNNSYAYDPEGHITSVDNGAAAYTHDAEGNRARKDSGGSWTEYVSFSGQAAGRE